MSAQIYPVDGASFAWLQVSVWVAVILAIGIVVVFAYHLIDQFRTPPISKKTRDSHRMKRSGLLLVGDDGYADYDFAKYAGSEGWAETKPVGKPKWNFIGFHPRPGHISHAIPVAEEKDADKTRQAAEYMNFLNTRKVQLRGSNNPIWVGVKSKAILMSILAIAGIQLTEEVQKLLAPLTSKPFPIDVSALKRMVVSSSYNQSQVIALTKVHEQIGFEKKPESDKLGKWFFIICLGMLIAGAAMLGAAAFLH